MRKKRGFIITLTLIMLILFLSASVEAYPIITISSPLNETYATTSLNLNWNIDTNALEAKYSLNNDNNVSFFSFTNVGHIDDGGSAYGIWGDGTYIYLGNLGQGLRAYTFDGTTFTNVGHIDDGGSAYGIWGDGTYIYLANYGDGLRAYTFDGTTFTNVGHIDDGGYVGGVWGDGTYIYLANFGQGLRAYTFDGTTFTNVGHIDDGGSGYDVWGDGTYIYLANHDDGLRAYTFNGTAFTNVGHIDNGGYGRRVWGDGTYIYLANEADGIRAYTFNGTAFTNVGHIDDGGSAYGIWGDGTYIYLGNYDDGIRAYTFDGTTFTNVGHIDDGESGEGVWGDGTYIYLANYGGGIRAYNYSFENTSITANEGSNNITLWVNDTNGNVNQTTVYFTVRVPPIITIQSPENTTYDTNEVWFNATGNEVLNWCGYSLDGNTNITMTNSSGNWNAQNTSMTEGSHYVTYSCNNTVGTMNHTTKYFTVDAESPYYITDCTTLNENYATYYLTQDIIDSTTSNCIDITANHITFDGQGYTIDGDDVADYGISVGGYAGGTYINTTIKNGYISDWDTAGIFIYGISNGGGTITNVTISSCPKIGLRLEFGDYLCIITNSTFINNEKGIYNSDDDNNILDNLTFENNDYGLFIANYADNNTITNSTFKNNSISFYFDRHGISQLCPYDIYIYNNLFNDTIYWGTDSCSAPYLNTTQQTGTRIYSSGNYIGGNYWTNSTGNGYSDICTDTNKDGFCDTSYTISSGVIDYLSYSDEYDLVISINNPENATISEDKLNVTFNVPISWSAYSVDGETNVSMGTSQTYNANLTTLYDGTHNVTIWANDTLGTMTSSTRYWTRETSITILPTTRTKAITNGSTDLFNLTISHDSDWIRNMTFTCLSGAICTQALNFTVTFENTSLNVSASETLYNEVNITTNASLPAGTYEGIIQVKQEYDNKTQNITLTYSSNIYASDIRMKDTFLTSITMDSDDTVARTIYYNNTGDWNGTHCNFSISSLSAYTTFSDQDFTIEVGDSSWYSTTMTISSPAVGTYTNLQVKLECLAYLGSELDSDISYIDISVTSAPAPPAGGGTTTIIYEVEDELGKPYEIAVYKQGGRYIPNLPVVISDCIPPTYEKRYAITIENRDDEAFVPTFSTSEGLEGYVTVVDDEQPIPPYTKKDYIIIMTTLEEPEGKIIEGAIYVSAGSTTVQIDGKWVIDVTCVTGLTLSGLFDFFKTKFFKIFMSFAGFNLYWGYLITLLAVLAIQQSKIKKESDKLQYRVTILVVALVALWMI